MNHDGGLCGRSASPKLAETAALRSARHGSRRGGTGHLVSQTGDTRRGGKTRTAAVGPVVPS
jgi:hypothetical protein